MAATISANIVGPVEDPGLPNDFFEPHWYAVYTNANSEKSVATQLAQRSVENLLPLYNSVRRWKDRHMNVQLPIFRGYVFVRVPLCDRFKVLRTPGVVRLVGFNGLPCALPDSEVRALKLCLERQAFPEPHPDVQVGHRVRIKAGPLEGLEGIVIRRKKRLHFILSVDLINCSAAVEIERSDLEYVHSSALSGLSAGKSRT